MFKTGLLIAGMALGIATGTATGNVYPLTGIVTETDEKTDTVYWNDGNNRWYFYGIEDWMEGDGISVIMCDNGTETFRLLSRLSDGTAECRMMRTRSITKTRG